MIVHRCGRDFERCARKYGKDWDEYCRVVPYKYVILAASGAVEPMLTANDPDSSPASIDRARQRVLRQLKSWSHCPPSPANYTPCIPTLSRSCTAFDFLD